MIRALGVSALLWLAALQASAQADSVVRPAHTSASYFGIQANQLFRQLINVSNTSASAINNPYLLTYAVNSNRTGWGLNVGLGYTYSQSNDGDATNKRETKINDLFFRVGFERKHTLGKRWLTSWGFDIVYDALKNNTVTTTGIDNNKSVFETTTKSSGPGFGPRFTLSYRISEKIYVGTEANYYYKSLSESSEAKTSITAFVFDPNTGQQVLTTTNDVTKSDSKQKNFQLNVPAVLYLVLKF